MPDRHRVAVLGGGSFGTVIANIIAANEHLVTLWMRNGERADIVFMAVPSRSCRAVARDVASCIDPNAMVVSTTKGIDADSFRLVTEVLAEQPHDVEFALRGSDQ